MDNSVTSQVWPTPKHEQFCRDRNHQKQIDKIGDIQAYLLGRNSAPDVNIDQFKYCPYCGKCYELKTFS